MGGWVMKVEEMACSLFSGRKRLNLGSGIAEVMPHVAFRRQILALIDLLDFLACETVAGQRIWRLQNALHNGGGRELQLSELCKAFCNRQIAVGFSQHCSFTSKYRSKNRDNCSALDILFTIHVLSDDK
jgi:hypothetical protein